MKVIVIKLHQYDSGITDVWVCKGYKELIATMDSYLDYIEDYEDIYDEEEQKLKEGWKVLEWDILDWKDEDYTIPSYKIPLNWKIDEDYWLDKTAEEFIEAFSGTYNSNDVFEIVEILEVE